MICYALDEQRDGKIVFFVRHGEAAHQPRAEGRPCRCDEPGATPAMIAACPFLDEALVDAPLTEKGRAQARAIPAPAVDVVLTAPMVRTLETATIAFSAPIIADEALRSRVSAHRHTRRRSRSELARQFPSVDFSLVTSDADVLWSERTEARPALDARLEQFLEALVARPEPRIAVVSHFTIFLTLFQRPDEEWIVGANPDRTQALMNTERSAKAAYLRSPIGVSEVRGLIVTSEDT